VLDKASGLRNLKGIKAQISREMENPSETLIRLLSADLMDGRRYTKSVIDEFREVVKQAFNQSVNDKVQQRLTQAWSQESERTQQTEEETEALPDGVVRIDGDIVTTQEEVDAFERVRTLVGEVIDPQRVFIRDARLCLRSNVC